MSRFFSKRHAALTPYTPGEQPKDRKYIKLNTNESPFPPSPKAIAAAAEAAKQLELYPDPVCSPLIRAMERHTGFSGEHFIFTNGSDDILNFYFMAFCDETKPAAFADITYGFYPVFAKLNHVPYTEIPLKEDFSIDPADYLGIGRNILIANPNAPTGIALKPSVIEEIVRSNPEHVILVDEAYVDFGAESCLPLIEKYDNLLVTGTFSKSRSMAGARLGFGAACPELIRDLETIRYSTNPYNINSMTMAAGAAALEDEDYTQANCLEIQKNRAWTVRELTGMGFVMTDSSANFLFAKHPAVSGGELYAELRRRGVLIRHFDKERITEYNRITIGSSSQMKYFVDVTRNFLQERGIL